MFAARNNHLRIRQGHQHHRVTFVELFFDLVFVFAITQVATLLLGDTSAAGFARSALVLALIWCAWSGFTWMTNAVDIGSPVTRTLFLAGMAGAFFAALTVPHAYGDEGMWFAVAYFAIRALNLLLYAWGLRGRPTELGALARLAPFFAGDRLPWLQSGYRDGITCGLITL